jgi:hypothetical protein
VLDAVAGAGEVGGGVAGLLDNLAASPELAVVKAHSDFASLYFFYDGKEEALVYRKGLYREDAGWRSVNLFQDLLPRADPPPHEGPAATGPREVNGPAESQVPEVNPVEDRAAGIIRPSAAGEDDPAAESWAEGAAAGILGIVGTDPPFRITPDGALPAPQVQFVPVENRDLAVVATLLAGDAGTGAEPGTTGPAAGEGDLPSPPTTVVVGIDPAPGEGPTDRQGDPGPFTGRPQAAPDSAFDPRSSMRRESGGRDGDGGFRAEAALAWLSGLLTSLFPPEAEAFVAPLEPAVSAVLLLGLWYDVGRSESAGQDPDRPKTKPRT